MTLSDSSEAEFVQQLTDCQLALMLYVRSLLPGDCAYRDVAQQANAVIWQKREEFTAGTNFRAWAFSIARLEVLSHRRRQNRESRLEFSTELQHMLAADLVARKDQTADRHTALQECLRNLSEENRQLLLHRYQSETTLTEYARRLGRSAGGLRVTLHRLRSVLLDCMQRRLATSEAVQ